jgi:hypothetical protein
MTKIQYTLVALALAAAVACSSPASETTPEATPAQTSSSAVPAEVAAVVSAARPGISITNGELNAAQNVYEVTGTMPNGDEVELDLVQANGAWTVVEIQRDVAWSSVPEPVRAAAATAPNSFEPVRVIESTQAEDGAVIFELFAQAQDGSPGGGPAMEVRWHNEKAEVVPQER